MSIEVHFILVRIEVAFVASMLAFAPILAFRIQLHAYLSSCMLTSFVVRCTVIANRTKKYIFHPVNIV